MISDVFKLLSQKKCDEIFQNPTPFFNNIVEDNFLKSYTCILCKDDSVAISYRNILADFVSKSKYDQMSSVQRSEAEAALLFLDAHIKRLQMNFLAARGHIEDGLKAAKNAGCHELVFRFMLLQCLLYHYCYHTDIALAYVGRMEKYAEDNSLKGNFHTDLCTGLCDVITKGNFNETELDVRASYFVRDFTGGWWNLYGEELRHCLDYYKDIFGTASYQSLFDKAMKEISHASSGFDAIREYYDKLTDNQRLTCNFRIGRDININTLNSDSFILESQNLANYLVKTQLSAEHKALLIEKFDTFLQEASFQLNLEVYKPFVSGWFGQYKENGIQTFCKYLGSRNVYDGITDAEMQNGLWTREHAMRRVMDNMTMILDMSEQAGSNVVLPVLSELIIRIVLYRYNYYRSNLEADNTNISKIASLIQSSAFDTFEYDPKTADAKFPYNLRSVLETYRAVVDDERRLSDSVVISAVLLEQYALKAHVIKNLCSFWGDDDLKFNEKLREKLETAFSVVAGYEIEWLDDQKDMGCVHGQERDVYIAFFSDLGEWDAQYEGNVFLDWRCEASKKRVSSPVSTIVEQRDKDREKNKGRESIGFVVLMPGCYLVNSDPMKGSLKADISIISYNCLYNSFPLYFSDKSKSEILTIANDEGIVKDSGGYDWDLFKIRSKLGDGTHVLRDQNPYSKLGFMFIINEFAKESKIVSSDIKYLAEIKGSSYYVIISGTISNGAFTPYTLGFSPQSDFGRNSITDLPDTVFVEDGERIMVHTMQFSNHEEELDYRNLMKVLADVLKKEDIIIGLRYVADNQKEKFLQAAVLPFAEKTAKTAIMARNMSHNLGSHVMFYIKQQLSSVNEMLRAKVFDQLFSDENDLMKLLSAPQEWLETKYKEEENRTIDNVALPFLVGLGRFMSYLQERQDFIASVATNFMPPSSSLNFKDFIYDELNPDKRYKRHPDRLGDKPSNILLSYIARSENLGRSSFADSDKEESAQGRDIVIKFGDFDGDPVETIKSLNYDPIKHYGDEVTKDKASSSLAQMRGLDFCIPSGVTGRHAFFSIIENIIRNSAKHGNFTDSIDNGSLKLTLNVYDKQSINTAPDNDNCQSELSLREVLERFYLKASDSDELYYVTITDNLPTTLSTVQNIRKAIMEPYVDEKGKMLENYKGIKEMRICASWLRSSFNEQYPFPRKFDDTGYITDDEGFLYADNTWPGINEINIGKAPTLYVRLSNSHLQYIFAVQKPLKVLIVSDCFGNKYDQFDKYDNLNNILKPNGWLGMSTSDYLTCEKRPDYEFVLWDFSSEDAATFNEIRSMSNKRTYRIADVDGLGESFMTDILDADSEQLSRFHELLLRHMSSYQEGDWILIDDLKAKTHFDTTHPEGTDDLKDLVRFSNSGTQTARFGYRTHFDTESPETFDNFFHSNADIEYREGVTGANSTDRLVRCDEINMEWFYRHLNIMKKSVAIFDERISNEVFDLLHMKLDDEGKLICRDHRPYVLSLKKMFIFNVIKEDDGIYIYGLYTKDIHWDYNDDTLHSYYVKLAQIQKKQDGYDVEMLDDAKPFRKAFDLLSIHQGILDKLYEWLGIKHQTEKIELLTKALYEAFCKGTPAALSDKTHFLLPGMSIHSGRSLPSADDMPQHLPFIQFASLENAFNDCKYSLVELLEHAYYDRK